MNIKQIYAIENHTLTNYNLDIQIERLSDILRRNTKFINLDKFTFNFDYNLFFHSFEKLII